MQANITHHTPTRKSIKVTVPAAEVSEEFGKVLAKIAPQAKIPGFRPGKAPKDVLMARYEREIHAEVTENLVNKHFWNAATNAGTQPISRPALEKVELKEGQDGVIHVRNRVRRSVPGLARAGAHRHQRRVDHGLLVRQGPDLCYGRRPLAQHVLQALRLELLQVIHRVIQRMRLAVVSRVRRFEPQLRRPPAHSP